MNKFDTIQKITDQLSPVFKSEEVELTKAVGRVLQEPIIADMDMPPFHKSAMDGYACRMEDIENELQILEVIHAGRNPEKNIVKNSCSKIMTGAVVPEGADCVFKVEDSKDTGSNKVRCTNYKTTRNICYQGEDYKKGNVLIKKGTLVNTSQMAVLAGAGYHQVEVSRMPNIALITTGSELVEPQDTLQKGKIRNSNASQLITQLQKMGINSTYLGIVPDDYEQISTLLIESCKTNDIVIFTGGASMGDLDLIPLILKDQEFKIYWDRTGIKPGNPMTFAQKQNNFCFGLSGNPVSSLVQFEMIAKPVIYKLLGANYQPLRMKVEVSSGYQRKKADRLGIVPVKINNQGTAETIPYNGSAHIAALVNANALMEIPLGTTEIKQGESAYVRPL